MGREICDSVYLRIQRNWRRHSEYHKVVQMRTAHGRSFTWQSPALWILDTILTCTCWILDRVTVQNCEQFWHSFFGCPLSLPKVHVAPLAFEGNRKQKPTSELARRKPQGQCIQSKGGSSFSCSVWPLRKQLKIRWLIIIFMIWLVGKHRHHFTNTVSVLDPRLLTAFYMAAGEIRHYIHPHLGWKHWV